MLEVLFNVHVSRIRRKYFHSCKSHVRQTLTLCVQPMYVCNRKWSNRSECHTCIYT